MQRKILVTLQSSCGALCTARRRHAHENRTARLSHGGGEILGGAVAGSQQAYRQDGDTEQGKGESSQGEIKVSLTV